ncbi:unnamed protein product [Lupinus luteus]|uniref:SLC26A/SulP transporter domain-containing protein n=1 Tax=Lupinus luteus TaxID=3873 RepID=A0AAV1YMN1_LUPLU
MSSNVVNSNKVDNFVCHETTTNTIIIQTETPLEIHKVQLPPKHTTLHKLKHKISEIFFPDNPLYMFKNKTLCLKIVLGFQYLFPIIEWGPKYNLSLFQHDLISGLTIASLAIPQGISYAKLANLPPITGLC